MKAKNKHAGSFFDAFLDEEGLSVVVDAKAVKLQFLHDLERQMKRLGLAKNAIRKAFKSPAMNEKIFSMNTGVSLETMVQAAHVVCAELSISLVPTKKKKAA